MIIMGIDPGLVATGLGVISFADGQSKLLGTDIVRTRPADPLAQRLQKIHQAVASAVEQWRPDAVVIESLFFAKNVKSALLLAHARAAAMLAAARCDTTQVVEYSPLEVKQAVVGYGRAGKEQIQKMVRVLLSPAVIPRSEHISDALACALCHAHRRKRPAIHDGQGRGDDISPAKQLLALARSGSRGRRRRR